MAEGQVSIRFSVQDEEVVRKALANLGKDGAAALRALDAAARQPDAGLSALDKLIAGLRERVVGMAVSIGPAGQALIALGPVGVAAAAGIGAVIGIIDKMAAASNALADKAIGVRNFAEIVGLSTDQVQALVEAGARLGRSPEQVQSFVERFTTQMGQLRRGAGELRAEILRIDPALAGQLATAKTTAEAWNLVARAYKAADDAGDLFRRNAIARAIGGQRGGLGTGALLGLTADVGGINALTQQEIKSGSILSPESVGKLALLRTEINNTNETANKLFTSIFSETSLQNQKRFADSWLDIAKAAKDFSLSPSLEKFFGFFSQGFRALQSPEQRELTDAGARMRAEAAAQAAFDQQRLALSTRQSYLQSRIVSEGDPVLVQRLAGALQLVNQQLADLEKKNPANLKVTINALHGSSPDVPLPRARPGDEPGSRTAETAESQLAKLRERIALLGAAATPLERERLAQAEVNAAIERNAGLSDLALRAMRARTLAEDQLTAATRERLGVITQEELIVLGAAQIDDQAAKGYIKNARERTAAEALLAKQIKETIEQQAIRNAQLPGLKQLEIVSGDLNKQFDQAATQGIGQVNAGLTDMLFNSQGAALSLKNLEQQLARTAVQMAINATIGRLLSTVLQGIFSFMGGGLGGGLTGGSPLGMGGIGHAAGGGSFGAGDWSVVGERGPELVRFGRDATVIPNHAIPYATSPGVAAPAAAGGPINVSLSFEDHAGVKAEQTGESRSGNDIQLRFMLRKWHKQDLAAGHFDSEMGGRFGARRPTQAIG